MFTAEQVEVLRSYLAQKATEPPPQPEMLMMGGDCTNCVPELKKLRESGYSLKVLVRVSEEKGVVISTNALSTYQTKLAPTEKKRNQERLVREDRCRCQLLREGMDNLK